ncbi:MAG: adenylate/guanylate cyclase domain-containing protein [Chitinophagaceae bacterium]
MGTSKRTFYIFFLLVSSNLFSQTSIKEDTALVNKLLQESQTTLQENPEMSMRKALQAKQMAQRVSFPIGEAYALKNLGLVYKIQGKYVEALDHYQQSLQIFKNQKDKIGIANLLNNIGSIHAEQGDDAKALEYCLQSLKIAEQTGDKMRIMSALINVGSIYHNKKDDKAINYLLQALPICEEIGNKHASGIIAANIGEIYADAGNNDKAVEYYNKALAVDPNALSAAYAYNGIGKIYLKKKNYDMALKNHFKALAICEKLDEKLDKMRTLKGIANTYVAQNDYKAAIGYYLKAKTLGEDLKANVELKDLYQDMSLASTKVADYPNALLYKTKYADIKDTLYKDETIKKIGRLQFDFDLYKKDEENNLLTKEKALTEAELKREMLARNALIGGLGLVLLIALLIFRNYRIKAKTNKILDRQKAQIETLLLNILPSEVATELQTTGSSAPRHYDSVSVLFTDFKGFTSIADKMSPQQLVEELSNCFVAFDNIIDKYKLEKIKTIGDSYMCAGGIPTPDNEHQYNIIKAGLEIQEYIQLNNAKRIETGLEPWEVRIGAHIGPVVAGVVGKRKYAYDIWGRTVNIASRMESNGEVGQVNISAPLHAIIKDRYHCIHRGKINAKNVGDIDMYFVVGANKTGTAGDSGEAIQPLSMAI